MPTITQTIAGAAQFTGLSGAGLFSFAGFNGLPATSRVILHTAAYHAAAGGNPGTEVAFYFVSPGGLTTERILLGRALAASILGPAGDGDVRFCGIPVPRSRAGTNWHLVATSAGKTVDATVSVDYTVQHFTEVIA
jgi:hypothetical protein